MPSSLAADRRGGIAGVTFVVLLVAQAVLLGQPKQPNASARAIAGWLADHRGPALASSYMLVLATVLFLFFAVALCRRLEAWGAPDDMMAVARLSAMLGLSMYMAISAVQVANVYLVSHTSADTTKALNAVEYVGGNLSGIPFGIFLVIVGWTARKTPAAPKWLAWSALLVGVADFASAGAFAQRGAFAAAGPVALLGALLYVWVLGASIHLLRARPLT